MLRCWSRATVLALLLAATVAAQRPAPLPQSLRTMVDTEREFAARALVVGWKQAFLEYFADDAVGFEKGEVGLAKFQLAATPDPPKDLQVLWEPRHGDVAGSGELGYLTGPVRSIQASRNKGRPRHSTYFSIWKRQKDGTFKVVLDVGVPTPGPAPFPAGFTRAANANRFTGDYDERTPPLATADQVLNSALRSGQSRAYRDRLAPGARLHRPNVLPLVGERAILNWLGSQRAFSSAESQYAESAQSGDLGYTWGTYTARGGSSAQRGFYVRAWARERSGQWKVAADVLQPQ